MVEARIFGGEDGIYAVVEELFYAADLLDQGALAVEDYSRTLAQVQRTNIGAGFPVLLRAWNPGPSVIVAALGAKVALLQIRAAGCSGVSTTLAAGLRRSHDAYRNLENSISAQFNEIARYPALLTVFGKLLMGQRPGIRETEYVVNNLPAYAADALYLLAPTAFAFGTVLGGPALGVAASSAVHLGAKALPLLRDKRHGGLFETTIAERLYPTISRLGITAAVVQHGPIHVVEVQEARVHELQGGTSSVLGLLDEIEHPNSVLVTKVERPDGQIVGIVSLPGTHGDDADGDPFGVSGLAESMALGSQHTQKAITEALLQVGVPEGSAVVLNGYSQGGVHAINIAADERFNEVFEPVMVMTVGAPVGQLTELVPEGLRTLHLEHVDDPVPGLDGRSNPHGADRVTLQLDGYGMKTPQGTFFGAGHDLGNYLDRLAQAQNGADNSAMVRETLAGHEAVLAGLVGTGAMVSSRHVRLERTPNVPVEQGVAIRSSLSERANPKLLTQQK